MATSDSESASAPVRNRSGVLSSVRSPGKELRRIGQFDDGLQRGARIRAGFRARPHFE